MEMSEKIVKISLEIEDNHGKAKQMGREELKGRKCDPANKGRFVWDRHDCHANSLKKLRKTRRCGKKQGVNRNGKENII
jgi:hypothetical protein